MTPVCFKVTVTLAQRADFHFFEIELEHVVSFNDSPGSLLHSIHQLPKYLLYRQHLQLPLCLRAQMQACPVLNISLGDICWLFLKLDL